MFSPREPVVTEYGFDHKQVQNQFPTYTSIEGWMSGLCDAYLGKQLDHTVTCETYGQSNEYRPLRYMHVSQFSSFFYRLLKLYKK